ncbi:MAG: chromosomal replication initiator protein DnaA [Oscillospiraceae bacterium]|nr:chromosomal replication initiator protein DnaA [Oscillospiraceae bacterium]
MNSFADVFEMVKEYCTKKEKIGTVARGLWIDTLRPVRLEGKKAVFYCDSNFQYDVVTEHYKALLNEALTETLGFPVEAQIIIQAPGTAEPSQEDSDFASAKSDAEGDQYAYTFDTFIVGHSNEFAYAACTTVAKNEGVKSYNPLFIYGPSGLGKTHLVNAISHEMKKNNPSLNIIYVNGEAFANELIEAIHQKKDTSKFHEKYRGADVLLVDDVQFISGRETTQEEFFHTFNDLHSAGKQIVLTSDRPPKEIKILSDRIRNRFESGLMADLSMPDFETRMAIIQRKAELMQFSIPNEVAEYIANHLKSNIRQLEGAVKKLSAFKQFAGSTPTISMAQTIIREILTDDQPLPITVEKIITEVANIYGVSPDDIRSNKRTSQISTARKVAVYLVREITQLPLQQIGQEFGGRDHSTIVYAVNNVNENLKKDENMRDTIDTITKIIRNGSSKG